MKNENYTHCPSPHLIVTQCEMRKYINQELSMKYNSAHVIEVMKPLIISTNPNVKRENMN